MCKLTIQSYFITATITLTIKLIQIKNIALYSFLFYSYLMQSKTLLIALLLVALSQTKLVLHEQVASGFACCPDTYIFDETTLTCVCPKTASLVDANNRCVSCNAPSYWSET